MQNINYGKFQKRRDDSRQKATRLALIALLAVLGPILLKSEWNLPRLGIWTVVTIGAGASIALACIIVALVQMMEYLIVRNDFYDAVNAVLARHRAKKIQVILNMHYTQLFSRAPDLQQLADHLIDLATKPARRPVPVNHELEKFTRELNLEIEQLASMLPSDSALRRKARRATKSSSMLFAQKVELYEQLRSELTSVLFPDKTKRVDPKPNRERQLLSIFSELSSHYGEDSEALALIEKAKTEGRWKDKRNLLSAAISIQKRANRHHEETLLTSQETANEQKAV